MNATAYAVADAQQDELSQQMDALTAKVDRVLLAVEQLDRRRVELEELITDLMPAANGALSLLTRQLAQLEHDGTLALLRSLVARAPDALHTAHALTAPEITSIAQSATFALANARKGSPPSWRTLLSSRKEPRIRRGLGALLEILRAVGSGSSTRASVVMDVAAAPRARAAAPSAAAHCATAVPAVAAGTREIAGVMVSVDAEGFLTDRGQWTRAIAQAIAAEAGVPVLSDAHWQVIDFCRAEAAHTGSAPGMRRITQQLGIAPKEMYALFPKGPGILAARIAGLGKPKSCV